MLTLPIIAPRVGAWVETSIVIAIMAHGMIAPRVGAWIETMYRNELWIRYQ